MNNPGWLQPADIELSQQRQEVICRAFLDSGCALP